MTDELLPCPFCKAMLTFPIKESPWGEIYLCQGCSTRFVVSAERYNTRPLEDALRKQLAIRDVLIEELIEAGQTLADELPYGANKEIVDEFDALTDEWQVSEYYATVSKKDSE